MADEMTATLALGTDDNQAVDGWIQQIEVNQFLAEEEPNEELPRFLRFAQKIVDNDPRMQALKAAPKPTEDIRSDLRVTAMEIQQDIQDAQNDFKRLNPDVTEAQVEEYITAVFERDIVTLDRIQKDTQRTNREEEEAETSDKPNSVTLNATGIAQNGGVMENRFTGQGTKDGIRRILFGNS